MFSTTGGPNHIKPGTGGDERHPNTSIDPTTSETRAKLSENEQFYGWSGNGDLPGSTPPFSMTSGPFLVKQNTGPDAGAQYASIDPTISKTRAHLRENKHFYGWRGNGDSPGSTPPFSMIGGSFLVKQSTRGDASHPYASIDPATSKTRAHLSENEHSYSWRGNGHSPGSIPLFSTMSGPFLIKLSAGPDEGAHDALIGVITSKTTRDLSENGQIYGLRG